MPNDKPNQRQGEEQVAVGKLSHAEYEELMQKLNEAEQKANEHWERVLRMQAEMDNLQRRAERDVANAHKYALERFALELIPIVDSLELCISNKAEGAVAEVVSFVEGINLTLKMFYAALEKFGIQQVNPVSQAFNPDFHQAISTQKDVKVKPGTVLLVLQKGYLLNNRLLRPALVIVASGE